MDGVNVDFLIFYFGKIFDGKLTWIYDVMDLSGLIWLEFDSH